VRRAIFLLVLVGVAPVLPLTMADGQSIDGRTAATVGRFLTQALQSALSIADGDDRANALSAIAAVEWQIGSHSGARRDFDLASDVLAQMPQNGLRQMMRQGLNIDRAEAGDIEGARDHLCHCPSSGLDDEEDLISAWAARALARSGDFGNAAIRVSSIKKLSDKDGVLNDLVGIALESGKVEEAVVATRTIGDPQLRIWSLNAIALDHAKHGHAAEASMVFDEALSIAAQEAKNTNRFNRPDSDNLYVSIAATQADSGDFSAAFSTSEQLVKDDSKDAALMDIATDAAKVGNVGVVRKALGRVQDPRQRPALNALLVGAVAKAAISKQV
jgi:hypothetical protein